MVEICINPDNQLLGTEPFSQTNSNNNKNSNNTNDFNYGDELTRNCNIGYETAEQLLKVRKVGHYILNYSSSTLFSTNLK